MSSNESQGSSLGAFVARRRTNPVVRKIAGLCQRYLSWYGNVCYDMQINGELFVLQRLAPFKPRVLFDVGANIGDWTRAAKSCCPDAEVYSFEVAKPTFDRLVANTARLSHTYCQNIGLADLPGTITIRYYEDLPALTTSTAYPHALPFQEMTANVDNGDRFAEKNRIEHIDLLKIDVEGMEEKVLNGFQQMLDRRAIDLIQFEYGRVSIVNRFLLHDSYAFFRKRGFLVGKIFPTYVDFREYEMGDEDFMGPNYLACREDKIEYIKALSRGSNGAGH